LLLLFFPVQGIPGEKTYDPGEFANQVKCANNCSEVSYPHADKRIAPILHAAFASTAASVAVPGNVFYRLP
jgi:hypothetical protein